ncbi:PepSY domain-containing protein [Bacillus sp. DTU_2020_1000418_1_SI_GHA_SEK_038]|uniref:PepSY domain-containing protein n=1 Tax=Bacillus sp. DTU_2020_1000418_1_SI_GHA_SEK_038 TaxID=3077585 RepID=UPI0028E97512|nr:PepSY domain-containing protein [Bacillus sp. DTU_2020_1000418_1_SI_GHA_SEK_038]WNS76716.1 PepSY domain-containing protein [Bacillus sp. DTU_2020_1000418_1_SI_GHA_SEK_038]
MMKHKFIIGAVSAAVILGGAVAAGAAKNDYPKAELQNTNQKMITHDEAIKIALTKAEGNVESVELENKFGKRYFEVEIENGHKDVEIRIDAISGDVLSVKEDLDDDDHDDDDSEKTAKSSQKGSIPFQKAIEISEKEVSGKVKDIDRDEDDDQLIYEVELKTNKGEAEVKINAVSGKVLDVEYDDDRDDDNDDDDDDDDDDRDDDHNDKDDDDDDDDDSDD